ncbi:MAG TPA: formate/nitrite transporter family protein [Alphaproteobacteria bacterium]|nr:formate/nitrite transporter family protein [Alphaproteobacteria bacterium]
MDYMKPKDVAATMVDAGTAKAGLAPRDLLVRGMLSGAILGFATSLAIGATVQTGQPIVGAVVFPVGFVMIVLLGLELVTGSFALVPLPYLERKISASAVLVNWSWVFLGNLIGALLYAGLYAVAISKAGTAATDPIMAQIVNIAQAKTLGYKSADLAGMATVFVKAILCNWMVCLGVVMGMTSSSTVGKIVAAWLPIVVFFAQGFEHSVVNMFVIPAGMLLGAKVSFADWWLWNQIPVTLGNIVGGFVFTGFALYFTHRPAPAQPKAGPVEAAPAAAE